MKYLLPLLAATFPVTTTNDNGANGSADVLTVVTFQP